MEYRITLSMPSYRRPERTIRAIESIINQGIDGWEALVVGDNCPEIKKFIESNYFGDVITECEKRGNSLNISNLGEIKGGWGYYIHNMNIQRSKGKYFTFLSNDDVLHPNHFHNYLDGIEGTDLDFAYYESYMEPIGGVKKTELRYGVIGHSEIIVRTEFLKRMPPHDAEYGHDWKLVKNMTEASDRHKKIERGFGTYIIKGFGGGTFNYREIGID